MHLAESLLHSSTSKIKQSTLLYKQFSTSENWSKISFTLLFFPRIHFHYFIFLKILMNRTCLVYWHVILESHLKSLLKVEWTLSPLLLFTLTHTAFLFWVCPTCVTLVTAFRACLPACGFTGIITFYQKITSYLKFLKQTIMQFLHNHCFQTCAFFKSNILKKIVDLK